MDMLPGKDKETFPFKNLYICSLIIKESHSKATMQNTRRATSSSYFFIQEPNVATAPNKTFLANTIKNTSAYNDSLRKREERDGLRKKKKFEDKVERKSSRLGSSRHLENEKDSRRPVARDFIAGEYSEATNESYRRLGQMVHQSKLKIHKTSINSLDEVLGRNIDPGPFGPIASKADKGPNLSLPQKCPW
jgi:hypothetical protein